MILALPEPNTAEFEIFKAALTACVAVIGLALTWLIGLGLTARWSVWQKQREIELQTATGFYELYGEFMTVWRLWKEPARLPASERRDAIRRELLARIVAAEGRLEAVMVRFATERTLDADDIRDLGLYRMGFRRLRYALKADRDFDWHWGSAEYHLLKRLACRIASRLGGMRTPRRPDPDDSGTALVKLTRYANAAWANAAKRERQRVDQEWKDMAADEEFSSPEEAPAVIR